MTDTNKTEKEPRSGLSDLTEGLCVDEFNSRQWWYKELEKLAVLSLTNEYTADMKRAVFVAMKLMQTIEENRT